MLNYNTQMHVFSMMDLHKLYKREEFQNAKNNILYEMCLERCGEVANIYKKLWKNKIYYGPNNDYRKFTHIDKKYEHFILFLAESVYLFNLAFKLSKIVHIDNESNMSSSIYNYLLDQGILGLCCKLYPKLLPKLENILKFGNWSKESKDGADEKITGLSRPCWYENFELIVHDRYLFMSMYSDVNYSNVICEFVGFNLKYIRQHKEEFARNSDTITNLLHIMCEPSDGEYPSIILKHVISVMEYLKDILRQNVKKSIKEIILGQIYQLQEWAILNL